MIKWMGVALVAQHVMKASQKTNVNYVMWYYVATEGALDSIYKIKRFSYKG